MKRSLVTLTLALSTASAGLCQTSYWSNSAVPGTPEVNYPVPVTLGLQFYSDVAGSVTGVRFYKGPHNTGTHVGTLWSASGTKLAEVTFSGETASGWQQANFSPAVNITAKTPYVISYFAPQGNYAYDPAYSWQSLNATPLHVSGSSPGVFSFASNILFPTGSYNASNYYVDLVFVPAGSSATPSAATTTSNWSNSAVPGTPEVSYPVPVTLGLQFYSDVAGSVTGVRFYKGPHNTGTHVGTLWSASGTKLAEVTFSGETASGWQQANFSPAVNITAKTPYVISYFAPQGNYAYDPAYSWQSLNATPLHVSGSSPGVFSFASNILFPTGSYNASNYYVDLVFVSAGPSVPPLTTITSNSYWSNSAVPGTPEVNYPVPVTLGLQFYSDVAGSVTGVRFYKGPHNTGTHVGTLWSASGTKLAEVTFSGETASGWQQANFSPAVNITAKTPYVISYFAPQGNYACDSSYSWQSLNATPLHVSGSSPGVFSFASNIMFPVGAYSASNYYVDLVFVTAVSSAPSSSAPSPVTYSITGNISGSAAKVTLSGTASGLTNTDSSGNYAFSGLPNGSYVVASSQSGFTFAPSTTSVSINGSSKTGVNFTATAIVNVTTYSISGKVSGSGAKVTLSGAASLVINTDASGNYSFSGLPNGSYTVAPSQSGFTFTPSTTSVSINGSSRTGVNFTATAISVQHSVTLSWTSSTSTSISGYNVYRAIVSGGPYTKLNASPLTTTSYLDSTVAAGQTYFYVATTVQGAMESTYSTQTTSVIPTP